MSSTIHHEMSVAAAPALVFEALADGTRFATLTGAPATGEAAEGEAFTAFGGHITGRQIELVAGRRIVQAWRAKTWPEGVYSIAHFELHAAGAGTKLVFEHAGFPADMREHLAQGWKANYWDKLALLENT
jgi:activator of HSP90 ATPase